MNISENKSQSSHLASGILNKKSSNHRSLNQGKETKEELTPAIEDKVELSTQVRIKLDSSEKNEAKNEVRKEIKDRNTVKDPKKMTYSNPPTPPKKFLEAPGIFLIGGFDFFGLARERDGGLELMAKNIPGAQYFSWDQKKQIMNEIGRRSPQQPIILVGHSLGGDLAVEIANQLNRMENQFRKVTLLVTLNSFGFNNKIIPPNVEKNLNYIAETKMVLNGPANVARDPHETWVVNDLRKESHSELDDSSDIQREIMHSIFSITEIDLSPFSAHSDFT